MKIGKKSSTKENQLLLFPLQKQSIMTYRKFLLSVLAIAGTTVAMAQPARMQVIHNCADKAADTVDIWVNGPTTTKLENVPFRRATAYLNLTPGTYNIGIASKTSTAVTDTFYNLNATLAANTNYVAVAGGIESATGYTPAPPLRISVFATARTAASNPANTDLLVLHGSTDAPTVDVRSGTNTLVNDIAFGNFSSYLELPTADYKIRITTSTGFPTVQTYSAPLQGLSLGGQSIVVLASGFLNPAANSNGPAFGLFVALSSGGALVPLPTTTPESFARIQAIHNCADKAGDSVDVYLNGTRIIDNFAFRTATGFIDVPAKSPVNVGIALKNSTSVTDTFYNLNATLDSAGTYILTANGIESPTGYTPNPAFRLSVFGGAKETGANSGNTDILVMHGSTDAPTVDVRAGSSVLVNDIAFGQYNSTGYISLPASNATISITDATGATTVQRYDVPLGTLSLGGQAVTVVASGFLTPANNSNGAAFGLYVALATGGALVALPVNTTSVNNVASKKYDFSIAPNPANDVLNIMSNAQLNNSTITITDVAGRTVKQVRNNGTQINIGDLNSGMYFLRIENGDSFGVQRFVKQ
ncbi:hypothetical protein CAP35_05385 [Chitinophagaceae bacterium IBVUCB1]|nr:hypothetical protein CAP35_05385 [Chitinophagaceae bacterium IBVUCB1]